MIVRSEMVCVVSPVVVSSKSVKGIRVTFSVGISQKAQSDQLLEKLINYRLQGVLFIGKRLREIAVQGVVFEKLL